MSGSPSISPRISSLTRSSCGSRRRCSIRSPEVGVQLAPRALDRLARRLARPAVLGIVLADHLVGPAEQQLPVVARHAEDPGDHRERERRGDPLDEVELARRAGRRARRRGSRPRCARCRRGCSRTARGVKRAFATRRIGPCFGGSSITTISDGGIDRRRRGASVIPCALEKRSGCVAISRMSACFVIAQNGS